MVVVLIVALTLAIPSQIPIPPPTQICIPTPITSCDLLPPPPPLPIPIPPPPCVPTPILPCPPIPIPPPPPPVGDNPPVFPKPLVVKQRTKTTLKVTWKAAIDDKKVIRYLFVRDKTILGWKVNSIRQYTFKLKCGKHKYRVLAVDVYLQADMIQATITRKC